MKDHYGRSIDYLRISVTDLCNLRCVYCMPPEGIDKQCHADILSFEEIEEIVRAAVEMGVRKIRITGGEPLVRKGIVTLCRRINGIPGVEDLAMTTNGILLPELAKPLYEAGLRRINISLDTLDSEKYKKITRIGSLGDAFAGIEAAVKAGMTPIKINTVLIKGFNDDEITDLVELTRNYPIDVRFIELMPIGHTASLGQWISNKTVLERVPELTPIRQEKGVAAMYRLLDGVGRVGLISPLSCHFCGECNRIRLTADGNLKPCLHSEEEISVRGLHGESLKKKIMEAVAHKPENHADLTRGATQLRRNMNQIGG